MASGSCEGVTPFSPPRALRLCTSLPRERWPGALNPAPELADLQQTPAEIGEETCFIAGTRDLVHLVGRVKLALGRQTGTWTQPTREPASDPAPSWRAVPTRPDSNNA